MTLNEPRRQEPPSITIKAPYDYERTHELMECPLCNGASKPFRDMHMKVREFGYFDLNLYSCSNHCKCGCGKPHKFSAKHELYYDAEHLKIYDRTHIKDIW
jgi:hypothetical protein